MRLFETGKYIEEERRVYPEGSFFEIMDDSMVLTVYLSSPSEEEIRQFSEEVRFGYAKVNDLLFFMSKIGEMPWMDSPYNLLLEERRPDTSSPGKGQGYTILIILVDASDGIIKHMRVTTLTHNFSNRFMDVVEDQKRVENYDEELERVYSLCPTSEHLLRYTTFQK